jgi:hypothetical protein
MSILDIPMYLYIGIYHVWWLVEALPWPTWPEIFKSLIVFVLLWRPRKWMETYWLSKPIRKRRGRIAPPSTKDHQAASASITDLFHH